MEEKKKPIIKPKPAAAAPKKACKPCSRAKRGDAKK